jgi:hypothetical protein
MGHFDDAGKNLQRAGDIFYSTPFGKGCVYGFSWGTFHMFSHESITGGHVARAIGHVARFTLGEMVLIAGFAGCFAGAGLFEAGIGK